MLDAQSTYLGCYSALLGSELGDDNREYYLRSAIDASSEFDEFYNILCFSLTNMEMRAEILNGMYKTSKNIIHKLKLFAVSDDDSEIERLVLAELNAVKTLSFRIISPIFDDNYFVNEKLKRFLVGRLSKNIKTLRCWICIFGSGAVIDEYRQLSIDCLFKVEDLFEYGCASYKINQLFVDEQTKLSIKFDEYWHVYNNTKKNNCIIQTIIRGLFETAYLSSEWKKILKKIKNLDEDSKKFAAIHLRQALIEESNKIS